MIYEAKKNGHISRFSLEPGNLKAKKKLLRYRREGWKITAFMHNDPVSEEKPSSTTKKQTGENRHSPTTRILGHRIGLA